MSNKPSPLIISGYSSQPLAASIAEQMGSRLVRVTYRQFSDGEIQTTIEENVRGQEVIVVASASGDPSKQEKEARLLMRAANRSAASRVTLFIPYMWYGRSDDVWDERNSPALIDTIENLRPHCSRVLVADPHNAVLTREKFLDAGGPVKECTIAHFAYPFAIQLVRMIGQGYISSSRLLFAHADAGGTKRISRSFRACLYNILGIEGRNPDQDDWPQGIKDRDKKTGKSYFKGISNSVAGCDVVLFEDMIASGGTSCDIAFLLKDLGAQSVTLCGTSGLFSHDPKKNEAPTAAIDRLNRSQLDAVMITDTYSHELTNPVVHAAIEQSPIIHVIKTGSYLGEILTAMHMPVVNGSDADENSVSALLKGEHKAQRASRPLTQAVSLKPGNPFILACTR